MDPLDAARLRMFRLVYPPTVGMVEALNTFTSANKHPDDTGTNLQFTHTKKCEFCRAFRVLADTLIRINPVMHAIAQEDSRS